MVNNKWNSWSCHSSNQIFEQFDNNFQVNNIILNTIKSKLFLSIIICIFRSRKGKQSTEPTLLACFINLLSIFLFVWFIIGNVWVYSIVQTVQYDEIYYPKQYCDKLCYMFSFWYITATWILIGLSCVCCCATLCCVVGISAFIVSKK